MSSKTCIDCNIIKPLTDFKKHKECVDGRIGCCKSCKSTKTREYEKSHTGFIMRLYRNMKSRITGVQKVKFHLYKGKGLLSKDEFYKWALSSPEYIKLHSDYTNSNYDRKLAPSVDRIDSSKGYELGNMEWVTMSKNSHRACRTRTDGYKSKLNNDKASIIYNSTDSVKCISKHYDVSESCVRAIKSKRTWKHIHED